MGLFGRAAMVACLVAAAPGTSATAGAIELRIARQIAVSDLPIAIIEHEKLIEKQAAMMGLEDIVVRWIDPGKGGGIEAVLRGQADLAVAGLGAFIVARDARLGTADALGALAAVAQIPYVLVSRDPAIKTIRDFSQRDRIAVPELKFSGPALMLEMASAHEWGLDQFGRLDPLAVSLPDAAAYAALRAGQGDLTAHFARPPFADYELADGAVHRVMDSFDIAGPHSDDVLIARVQFYSDNPKLCAAVFAAVQEADALIKANRGAAAEIYAAMAPNQEVSVEDLSDMVGDPDAVYTPEPAGVARLAEFMFKIKRISHRPESWKELFFPDVHPLPGN